MMRQATPQDHRALFTFARNAARKSYPRLREDVERMANALREVVSNPHHFAWLATEPTNDGREVVKAALLAVTNDNAWAQRKHSQIVLWQSDIPGVGLQLLLRYRRWIEGQRAIRFAGLAPGVPVDPNVFKIAEAAGFTEASGARIFYN